MVILHNGWELQSWEMRHSRKHFDDRTSLFSASYPFVKVSVRQNIHSANVRRQNVCSAKCPFGKMSIRQSVFRQNVRVPRTSAFKDTIKSVIKTERYVIKTERNNLMKLDLAILWVILAVAQTAVQSLHASQKLYALILVQWVLESQ